MDMQFAYIESPKEMSVPLKEGKLVIYTGIAVFNVKGDSEDWSRENVLEFNIGKTESGKAYEAVVTASLNSISIQRDKTGKKAENAGWAVDKIEVKVDGDNIKVSAEIAVRGTDSYVDRMGYQVTTWVK